MRIIIVFDEWRDSVAIY